MPAQAMGTFQQLNNNNLYLVSLDDDPAPLTTAQSLSLALTARIVTNPGDPFHRGQPTAQPGRIQQWPTSQLTSGQRVDPVILDLAGTGLPLTSLDQGVNFAMLPQAEAIYLHGFVRMPIKAINALPPSWCSMTSNDATNGDVQISSITELLSEF